MPTYQYACTECGHRFEQVQTFHEDALTHCPECEGRLRKVFNAVGVVFKGSGFYRTDSRAASSASVTGSSGESSSANGSEGGSKGASDGSSSSDGAKKDAASPATSGSSTASSGTKATPSS